MPALAWCGYFEDGGLPDKAGRLPGAFAITSAVCYYFYAN